MTLAKIRMSKYDLQFASTSLQSRDQYKISRKSSFPALHKTNLRIYTHTNTYDAAVNNKISDFTERQSKVL